MAKKNERAARHAIIVDMNDFLMDYAAAKLGAQPDLAQHCLLYTSPSPRDA